MKTSLKVVSLFAVAAVAGSVGCSNPWPWLLSGFPFNQGSISGLPVDESIEVRYDAFGVPHITATTDADLFFALGYVHGRDRLAQMEQVRLSAKGQLSSVLGAEAVEQDILALGMELDWRVAENLAVMGSETRENLESYVAGINTQVSAFGVPFEFAALGRLAEAWTVEDVLRMGLVIDSPQMWFESEYMMDKLIVGLGADAVSEFFGRNITQDVSYLTAKTTPGGLKARLALEQLGGSNSWVVSGNRTATGLPLLASDPHNAVSTPGMMYLVVADTPTWSFRGATVPGLPLFAMGTNGKVSYGLTSTAFDVADTFVEELDETGMKYRVDDEWRDLRLETYWLSVAGELLPRLHIQAFTHRGPLVEGASGSHTSLQWSPGDAGADVATNLELLKAGTVEEAMRIVRKYENVHMNYLLADVDGNIGWQVAGWAPLRPGRIGLLSADGTRSDHDWQGRLAGDDLPREMNPDRGYIANANNRPTVEGMESPEGMYAAPFRVDRIEELLDGLPAATPADMATMQQDVQSLEFEAYREAIADATGVDPVADSAIGPLLAWDGRMSADSRAAVLFDSLLTELAQLVLVDRLPTESDLEANLLRFLDRFADWPGILANPTSSFWMDVPLGEDAPGPAGRRTVMTMALRRAAENAPSGDWGEVNRYDIRHQLSPLLSWLWPSIDLPPAPIGGGGTTVFANTNTPYGRVGSCLRLIADMATPNEVQVVLPTGQSGRPESPHYADQYDLWLRGEYLTLPSPPLPDDTVIALSP